MLHNINDTTEYPELLPDFLTAERSPYTGLVGVMDRTDRPHYDKHCKGIVECLKPANPLEGQLAFSIASDYWRLNRIRNIEDGIFASCHPNPSGEFGSTSVAKQIAQSQTAAFLIKQADFKFLSQYEMRIQRTLNRNKAELKQLQAERRKFEIENLAPQPDDRPDVGPDRNGFAFSEPPSEPEMTRSDAVTEEQTKVRTATNHSQPAAAPNGFAFSNPFIAPAKKAAINEFNTVPQLPNGGTGSLTPLK